MNIKTPENTSKLLIPLLVIIFAVAVGIILKVQDNKLISTLEKSIANQLSDTFREQKNVFDDFINTQHLHLSFLLDTPPIQGISRAQRNNGIDPVDGTKTDIWATRLSIIFTSLVSNYPAISQVRLIDAKTGFELVRVDKIGQNIKRIPQAKLQNKGSTEYFKETIKLAERSIYTSELNLNRENGVIEYPIKPTIRFAVPVYNDDNDLYAFVITNVLVADLLKELQSISGAAKANFSMLDQDGNIIEHTDERYIFTKDLAPELSWERLFKSEPWHQYPLKLIYYENGQNRFISLFRDLRFAPISSGGATQFTFINSISESNFDELLLEKRLANLGYFSIIFVIFIIITLILLFYIKSAAQLKKTRTEFAAIIHGASDGIIAINKKYEIESYNTAAADFFPELNRSKIGLPLTDVIDFVEEFKESLAFPALIESDNHHFTIKASNNKDVLRVKFSQIVDENNQTIGTALFIQDISEQLKYEQEIKDINASLEEQITERTAELEKERKNAINASNIKSKFVSTISHEMRTPLNGILGSLDLISQEPHSEHVGSLLTMMDSSANSLAVLINDVLDLSKIEAGKLEITEDECNVINLIEDSVIALSPQAVSKGIDLDVDITAVQYSHLNTDAGRLIQILNNLIGNALKFTLHGGVYVAARTSLVANKVRLEVEIIDSGIGIAKENQQKLFQSFAQENNTIASEFGGTGLGLSISKQLCELMDGDISVVSEKGKGSTFSFYIDCEMLNTQLINNVGVLNGESFQLFLCSPFLEKKWANVVRLLGGTIVNEQAQYLIVDCHHAQYQHIKEDEKTLANTILLSRHLENHGHIKHSLAFLNRPTKLLSVLRLFSSDTALLDMFKPEQPLNENIDYPNLAHKTYLVVDDNYINVKIASHLLAAVNAKVIVANSGVEALEKLIIAAQDGVFISAVLMDCQMPIMDGYEATSRIRAGEAGDSYITTPIIALTANAMSGEREKCLALGMSEYLTKPIESNRLYSILNDFIDPDTLAQQNSQINKNNNAVGAVDTPLSLDKADALERLLGDEALYTSLLDMFIEDTPEMLSTLRKNIEEHDLASIKELSHELKGVAGNIGATKLQVILRDIESATKQNDLLHCQQLINELDIEYQKLITIVEG
ncbi:hypothetical protein GCM10009111_07960 [Colwellia asteriadis]|uniref:histidine kinase n=1 Tax=Colwellia asteriadis TaxID=517723 RepID=A0ABP3WDL9_9GAMM